MRIFILGLCLKAFAQDSYSEDYNQNPDKYYRDPCPKTRVVGERNICNALDEYVWRKDDNYKWELIETKEKLDSTTLDTTLKPRLCGKPQLTMSSRHSARRSFQAS